MKAWTGKRPPSGSRDQAFVRSDWLYQVMFQSDDHEGIVHDRAVWSPIYAISGTLDKTLSEIFMPGYGPRLEAAKERLRADLHGVAEESTATGQGRIDAPQAHQIERETAGNRVKAIEGNETWRQANVQFSSLTRLKRPQLPKLRAQIKLMPITFYAVAP
ncbi:hypothetical protein [Streptomyces sp. NPDC002159]